MPNGLAYFALMIWPIITLFLFASMRPLNALIWSLLGGYLLLPVNTAFDFPGVPALDKSSIPSISALVGAILFVKGPVIRLPREPWAIALMAIYIFSPIFTVLTNGDPLQFGILLLPGLKPYDAFSAAAYKGIDLIPFVLGYNLLKGPRAQNELLRALVGAALAYSLLMLVEIRFSPQLHRWIYGFFPHSFAQQMRDGGFRPVVFLGHGLEVAIFTALALVAAAYLAKAKAKVFGVPGWVCIIYLAVLLVFCRSLGALFLGLAAVALLFIVRRESVRIISALAAIIVIAYPVLRGADLVPVQALTTQIAAANEERAASFQFRIENEDILLARANERPIFGWGGYGRNRVYNQETGIDLSVTDGTWIIVIGSNGWAGYLATFGLLCGPLLIRWRRRELEGVTTAVLSLILCVNLIDLFPNSSLTPITWMLAGALLVPKTPSPRNQASTRGPYSAA